MLYEFCKVYRCYEYAYVEANSDEEAIEKANRRDTQYEDNGDRDIEEFLFRKGKDENDLNNKEYQNIK